MISQKFYFISENSFSCDITPKRITEKYELEIYDFGEGASSINGKIYSHSNNKVVFSKPFQERFSIGKFNCNALHFACNDEDISDAMNDIPDCILISPQTKKQILEYYDKISLSNKIVSYSALLNILRILSCQDISSSTNSFIPSAEISFIKEYIDNNFTNSINVSELSKKVYFSPNYIRKKFVDSYGLTIQKYIIDMRLSLVKKLIITTNKSLCDIAYCSGFNSQSHMNYMFKAYNDITPLEYKKQIQRNNI